ncbi:hypothetical protein KI387_000953, partial [Taxus chinensis]
MGRAPCCDKMGIKKGPWSGEEDRKLVAYIRKYGHGNWRALPMQAGQDSEPLTFLNSIYSNLFCLRCIIVLILWPGLMRCGKSCRLRWSNYLRPDLKRGNFTLQEEQTIVQLHQIVGNRRIFIENPLLSECRWAKIASFLPGRTDNDIKNVWNTRLKKCLNNVTTLPEKFEENFCDESNFVRAETDANSFLGQRNSEMEQQLFIRSAYCNSVKPSIPAEENIEVLGFNTVESDKKMRS